MPISAESEAPLDGFGDGLPKAKQLPISAFWAVEVSDKPTWSSIEAVGVHLDIGGRNYPFSHRRALCLSNLKTECRNCLTWLLTQLGLVMGRCKDA